MQYNYDSEFEDIMRHGHVCNEMMIGGPYCAGLGHLEEAMPRGIGHNLPAAAPGCVLDFSSHEQDETVLCDR